MVPMYLSLQVKRDKLHQSIDTWLTLRNRWDGFVYSANIRVRRFQSYAARKMAVKWSK